MKPGQEFHDLLLSLKSDGTPHVKDDCPWCAHDEGVNVADPKTYSEDDLRGAVDAAVAQTTAALNARIAELETSHQQSEFDSAVATATATLQSELDEVRGRCDTAVAEAASAKSAYDNLVAYLAAEKETAEAAAAISARKDARVAAVKETIAFPDEHLTANADRWAEMDDAAFDQQLADYKALAARLPATAASLPGGNTPPAATAMTAAAGGAPGTRASRAELQRQAMEVLRPGRIPAGA